MNFRLYPRTRCILLWSLALCMLQPGWAQKNKQKAAAPPVSPDGKDMPDATIPLQPLGYQGAPVRYMLAGAVANSLHYVDPSHLLLTYRARMLIPRDGQEAQGDDGQMITAMLLEAPSGKVVAQTQWRMYDHGQYLWPIGRGVFLLRKGRQLSLLTPLAEVRKPDPLRDLAVGELPGTVSNIMVSPDGRMVIAEAELPTQHETTSPAAVAALPDPAAKAATVTPAQQGTDIQFLRLDLTDAAHGRITMSHAGHSVVASPLGFPLSGDGHLHAEMVSPDDWNVFYTPWRGGSTLLGDVVSTCAPQSTFLSGQEVLVVTCNGGDGNRAMAVVTLDKHELWQEKMNSDSTEPGVKTAIESGRFAISTLMRAGGGTSSPLDLMAVDSINAQRIEVRDIKNGMLVASVDALPVQRAGQNYSLSQDGMHLAVLQNDVIAIYDLAPVKDFPAHKIKPNDLIFVAATEKQEQTAKAAEVAAHAAAVIEAPLNVDERRTPPTLYTPEEKAEQARKAQEKNK